MNPIYLDWNATTPPLPEVIDAVAASSRRSWGNPSSVHAIGSAARRELEDARERVASLLGRPAFDVVFTSGGTESNNLAIRAHLDRAGQVLCSRLEHPSILRVVEAAQVDHSVHWLAIDHRGRVDPGEIERWLGVIPQPALVVIQWVNHETGVIQPVQDVVRIAHAHGAVVHVDAVQGVGKLDGRPWCDADTVTVSAHKIRGPKGIGALLGAACQGLRPLLLGGPQERKLRPGTVSVPLAVGFGVAASWASSSPSRYDAVRVLRDHLEDEMTRLGARRNGEEPRAPHVTNVSFEDMRGEELVAAFDVEGVCLSGGSACSAGSPEASSVVSAMLGAQRGAGAVRASLGEETSQDELSRAIEAIRRVIGRARGHG